MASSTVGIDKSLPEMEKRIGVYVAVYTSDCTFVVDVLRPFPRVYVERTDIAVLSNLENFWLSMADEASLVFIGG